MESVSGWHEHSVAGYSTDKEHDVLREDCDYLLIYGTKRKEKKRKKKKKRGKKT